MSLKIYDSPHTSRVYVNRIVLSTIKEEKIEKLTTRKREIV